MTHDELMAYCPAKPGAWPDEPWEGDVVAKVMPYIGRSGWNTLYASVVSKLPEKDRPAQD